MTRPLREVTTYLVLAFSMAIGIAVAMPHAGINALLSAFAPITAVLVITFADTRPRQAPRAVGQLRTEPLRQADVGRSPSVVPMLLAASAYGVALVHGRRRPAGLRPHARLASARGP